MQARFAGPSGGFAEGSKRPKDPNERGLRYEDIRYLAWVTGRNAAHRKKCKALDGPI